MALRRIDTTDRIMGVGPDESQALRGLQWLQIRYDFINDGQTHQPGPQSIVDAYFKPDADHDMVIVTLDDPATIHFHTSGILHSGTVLIGHRGY